MSTTRPRFAVGLVFVFAAFLMAAGPAVSAQEAAKRPFTNQQLFQSGAPRIFEGESLREVAFPLGGIGTGTVSLGGRGNLRDWEIFNRPDKGVNLPFTFLRPLLRTGRTRAGRARPRGPTDAALYGR